MAQRVSYWQDDVCYQEGPFVLVNANGWRIEVEGPNCPILLDRTVYRYLEANNKRINKSKVPEPSEEVVDWLNQEVKNGNIVKKNGFWVVPSCCYER